MDAILVIMVNEKAVCIHITIAGRLGITDRQTQCSIREHKVQVLVDNIIKGG